MESAKEFTKVAVPVYTPTSGKWVLSRFTLSPAFGVIGQNMLVIPLLMNNSNFLLRFYHIPTQS